MRASVNGAGVWLRAVGVALLAGLLTLASPAFADPINPSSEAGAQGVIAYPASFFATMGLNTAYDMVQRIPGFTFDDGAAVRGFAGAAGNVLIDGRRPASKTDDLAGVLQRIPVGQVERIDLIRGGAPGVDMQGKTIVANVIRRKAAGFTGDAALAAYDPANVGFDPSARVDGVWRDGERSLQLSLTAGRFHDDTQGSGPHDILAPDGRLLDASKMRNSAPNWTYLGVTAYEAPLFGGAFAAKLTLEDQPYDLSNIDDFQIAGPQVERSRQDTTDAELGLHYARDLPHNLNLELFGLGHLEKAGTSTTFQTATDDQDFGLSHFGGESIGRGVLHWRPAASLTVDGGGEFSFNWLNARTTFTDNGAAIQVPAGDVDVQEKRGEIFTTTTWRPTPVLSVEAGARVEASTISSSGDVALAKTLIFAKPRLAVTWTPDTADQVRLRVEREVGQLDFNAFVANAALNSNGVVAGNPDLTPQQDWAFEVAYDRHFWRDGVVSLTARYLILREVIDRAPVFSPSGVFDEPANIGGGHESDLVASFNLPLQRLGVAGASLRGIGTWRFSQVVDPTTGERRAISGQHPLDAELHFSQDLPRFHASWGLDGYISYRERYFRFDEIDTNHKPTYADLFVEYKPRADLSLRIQLEATRHVYDITRQVYGGPRDADPLVFTDVQSHRFGPVAYFRIRKTFG